MLWLSKMLLLLGGVKDMSKQKELLNRIKNGNKLTPHFHPTIWFNAWKFSQEEQIWAALTVQILEQLSEKYPWPLRLLFRLELARERSTPWRAVGHIALNLLPAILVGLSYVLYHAYLLPYVVPFLTTHLLPLFQTLLAWFPKADPNTAATGIANTAGIVVWAAAAVTAAAAKFKQDKVNPFKISIKDIIDPPNYEEKIGYIGRFEEDFKRIVRVITRLPSNAWETQKLVIFIDDLDRCRPFQAVNIVEAISLFLGSEQCVFIVGMDQASVATSIEAKYKELAEKMRRDMPSIVSPGSLFLEKMIQISFNIPKPKEKDIDTLVEEILNHQPDLQPRHLSDPGRIATDTILLNTTEVTKAQIDIDRVIFKRVDVKEAIKKASKLLQENPRQVKRFINLFRLKVYLANKLRMLYGENLVSLAMVVAWSIRWPEVAKLLLNEVHSSEICYYLQNICERLQDNGTWKSGISDIDDIHTDLLDRRKNLEKLQGHWCQLPWEEWICDQDFRTCLKELEKEDVLLRLQSSTGLDIQDNSDPNLLNLMRL